MLNKKDPLIDAVQQVMQSNQADRDAVKAVNEKFGIQDRRVLPHERQGEWDAAYKTVLTEGVEALDEDWDPIKLKKAKKIEKGAKSIKAGSKGHIKDFGKLIADRTKNDAVTGLDSASGAKKAMKQLYSKNKGDSGAIKKISEEEKLSSAQKHHMDVDDDNDIDSKDLKMKRMGMKESKKMKGDDPCWDNPPHKMVGMKKGKGGKPVPKCVPVSEEGDPSKAIPGDTVTGGSSVTTVPKPKPKPTSITPEQQNALKKKIQSIKEAMAPSVDVRKAKPAAPAPAMSGSQSRDMPGTGPGQGPGAPQSRTAGGKVDLPASRLGRDMPGTGPGQGPGAPQSRTAGGKGDLPSGTTSTNNNAPPAVGGARPSVVAKNSYSGAQKSTGNQVGGARPSVVAKNSPSQKTYQSGAGAMTNPTQRPYDAKTSPTAKAPVPTSKPTGGSAGSKVKPGVTKLKPVRKQPNAGAVQRPGVAAKPVKKLTPLQQQMKRSRTNRDSGIAGE